MPDQITLGRIRGKDAILHKIVFELRYWHGLTYLDRCGRTINTIIQEYPEWVQFNDANPQTASLVSLTNSCQFNFSTKKMDFSWERSLGEGSSDAETIPLFAEQVATVSAVVIDRLDLKSFARIGYRVWYLFPANDQIDSENWIKETNSLLGLPVLADAFGGNLEAVTVASVITSSTCKYRVSFSPVERHAQFKVGDAPVSVRPRDLDKNQRRILMEQQRAKVQRLRSSEFASMVDVDAYVDEPSKILPKEFVMQSHTAILAALRTALGGS